MAKTCCSPSLTAEQSDCSAVPLAWAAPRPLAPCRQGPGPTETCQYQEVTSVAARSHLGDALVLPGVGGSARDDGSQAASGLPAGHVSAARATGLLAMLSSVTSSSSSFGSLQQHTDVAIVQASQCFSPLLLLSSFTYCLGLHEANSTAGRASRRTPGAPLRLICFQGTLLKQGHRHWLHPLARSSSQRCANSFGAWLRAISLADACSASCASQARLLVPETREACGTLVHVALEYSLTTPSIGQRGRAVGGRGRIRNQDGAGTLAQRSSLPTWLRLPNMVMAVWCRESDTSTLACVRRSSTRRATSRSMAACRIWSAGAAIAGQCASACSLDLKLLSSQHPCSDAHDQAGCQGHTDTSLPGEAFTGR